VSRVTESKYLGAFLWRWRHGHLGFYGLERLVGDKHVRGLNVTVDELHDALGSLCEPCLMGKQCKLPSRTETKALAIRETKA
jgi:hypothetical protein